MNRVEVTGGLVREPELRILPSGVGVCEFSLAVNGARWDSEARQQVVATTYVACQLWDYEGELFAEAGLDKGDEVYVLGELDQKVIEKKDGSKESKTRIRVLTWAATRRRSRTGRIPREHVPDPAEVF